MPRNISDLVCDSELEIQILPDHIIQTVYISNPTAGERRTRELEKWQCNKKLGQGGFGVVWLQKCTAGPSSGKLRAVKEIPKRTNNVVSDYRRELEAIAKFSQARYRDHFVRSFGWYQSSSAVFITMEYLSHGDLEGCLDNLLSHNEARQITQQVLEGLHSMHKNNFAHRDLKPRNVLVLHKGPNWWVKIADFGISKRIDGTALRTAIGTEDYLAPEVQGFYPADFSEEDERTFSLAVDIWSVGAIAFRMIVGNLPFPSKRKLSDYAMRGQPFPTEESLGLEGTSFIMETMAASPRLRPTSQQALSHPWIVSQGSISGNFGQSHSQRSSGSNFATTQLPASLASAQWSTLSNELLTARPSNAAASTQLSLIEDLGTLRVQDNSNGGRSIALSPDERLLDAAKRLSRYTLIGHSSYVFNVAFSPNGKLVASSDGCTVRLWDTATGAAHRTLTSYKHWAQSVAFSPDGKLIGSVMDNMSIQFWDVATGVAQDTRPRKGGGYIAWSVAFSPSCKLVASGEDNGTIQLWDVATGAARYTLTGHTRTVRSVAFSLDDKLLASGGADDTVRLWDAATGAARCTLTGHSRTVCCVAFSPDGKLIASGGADDTVRLWDAATGAARRTLMGHRNVVRSVAFSPNGKFIASGGGADDTIRLWDVATGAVCGTLTGHSSMVYSVTFSPDSKLIASGSWDKTVRLWDV